MFCIMCGAKMRKKICPNCGYIDGTFETRGKGRGGNEYYGDEKPIAGKDRKSRKKAIIIVAAVSTAILAAAGVYLSLYLIKDAKYEKAISSLENGRAQKAAEEFKELGDYKDSEYYLEEAQKLIAIEEELEAYNEAVQAYEDKDYEAALEMFEVLGSYKNSEEYALICRNYLDYLSAMEMYDAGDYVQAEEIFLALGDYKNSIETAQVCRINIDYSDAMSLFEKGDYEEAQELFISLDGFEDSDNMANVCAYMVKYDEAVELYNGREYEAASELFLEVNYAVMGTAVEFPESFSVTEFKYAQGLCYYAMEYYLSAFNAFSAAGNFKDASEMAEECSNHPFYTEEIYRNEKYSGGSVKVTLKSPADAEYNVFVVIEDYTSSSEDTITMCTIKKGEQLTIYIPDGVYFFYIYYGKEWFGCNENFGKNVWDEIEYYVVKPKQSITIKFER